MKRTVIYLIGSFVFTFLLGELVHEYGHYLMHLLFQHDGVSVVIDPFGGSHNVGVTSMPMQEIAWTTIMGPMSNVILATCVYFIGYKTRFLPLTIWLPVALLQEGVTFSLGSMTNGGDAQWIAASTSIPLAIIIILGTLFLLLGMWLMAREISQLQHIKQQPYMKQITMIFISMGSLMVIRFLYSLVLDISLIVENLVPLIFSLIVTSIVAFLIRFQHQSYIEITKKNAYLALALGVSMFVIQLLW